MTTCRRAETPGPTRRSAHRLGDAVSKRLLEQLHGIVREDDELIHLADHPTPHTAGSRSADSSTAGTR
jgi:hypothetical protein